MLPLVPESDSKELRMDFRSAPRFFPEVFGLRSSYFLSHLNVDHPDLFREPFASFLDEAVQMAVCSSFCVNNGLDVPFKAISASAPRSHDLFFAACRLLDSDRRRSERCRKIPLWLDFRSFKKEASSASPDMPESFDRFGISFSEGVAWYAMESSFRSAGCIAMAEAARLNAVEHERDELGLARLSIKRATLILGKRIKAWSSDRELHPVAVPPHMIRLPDWASDAIRSSEVGLSGHPLFDHHVAVCFLESPSIPESLQKDIVVLGERDGVFHFLCSD